MADAKSIQEPVVRALAEHIASFPFQRTFEEFFLKNALSFSDEVEHELNYMTVYIEFQQLFNHQMADFLEKQKISEDEFAAVCQRAIKADKRADNFLEIVLASMDYDAFFQLMKAMRGRARAERKPSLRGQEDDDRADTKSSAKSARGHDEDDGEGKGLAKKRSGDDDDDGKDAK